MQAPHYLTITSKFRDPLIQSLETKIAAMAAHDIMGTFINGFTQGKTKEYMEKNKSNLEKHIKKTIPVTRDATETPKAPDVPGFSGNNKTSFETICAYIRDYNEYTFKRIHQQNEDHKDEILRDLALMVTGNAGLLVENLDNAKEIKSNFVSSIETASKHKISNEENFGKVLEEIKKVGTDAEKGFKNLVPGNGTPGAVNHSEMITAVEKCHLINENKVQSMIRGQTTTIINSVREVKEAIQPKQTGTGNNSRPAHGPPKTTPTASAWGTTSNPRPPPAQTTTPNPTQTPAPAPAQPSTSNPNPTTGSGSAPNQEPELITVTRAVPAVDEHGVEYTAWTDVHGVKKRNKQFRFTKDAEDAFKAAEAKEAETTRARRQIMIYGLPDPPVGNKKTEIGNIRMVADEFSKKWLQDKGFNIQKSDLKNCLTQRLWNYGGKTHKGPKPLKVTFDSPEIANKFMKAAKAAGCDGSRSKIKFGKFQEISFESEEFPKYFLRPGSTWDERQVFLAKKKERDAHKAGEEYARYKAAKERTNKNTHRVEDNDLDEFTFLDPDDCGENDPTLHAKNKCPPGGGKKSPQEDTTLNPNAGPSTGSGTEESVEDMDESNINSEKVPETVIPPVPETVIESNLREDDDETTWEDAVNEEDKTTEIVGEDKKRKSNIMSPGNSLALEQTAKKISLAEPSKESS